MVLDAIHNLYGTTDSEPGTRDFPYTKVLKLHTVPILKSLYVSNDTPVLP